MHNTIGIILTGGINEKTKALSEKRSVAAIPVAGKYRAIDFVLSNMVNSGINKVGVVTQYSYRSLMDHLGSGKEWDLDRRNDGLFVFPPYLSGENSGWYRGTADGIYNNLTFLKRSNAEYALVTTGNCIYKMLYDDLLSAHVETGADITVVYRDMSDFPAEELQQMGIIKINEEGRITDLQEKPVNPSTTFGSMGVYVMRKDLLVTMIEECHSKGYYDFVKDILIRNMDCTKIMGYRFEGYWRPMASVPLYFNCNMDMLKPEVRKELFWDDGRIFTKVKDETPSKYNDEAQVTNSVVADGCIIEGTVIDSVLFRGVTVKRGAVIRNSIIMQGSVIEENASLDYAILDKEVVVSEGKSLKGELTYPFIVTKKTQI